MNSEKSIASYAGLTVINTEYDEENKPAATAFIVDGELAEIQWTPQLKDALFGLAALEGTDG